MRRGRFITFEGGEAAGKSTQIEHLASALRDAGETVVLTREPGGTPGAEAIRHALLGGAVRPLGPLAEAACFAAARADNVDQIILPALRSGRHVISDRFGDSSRAYQRAAGEGTVERLQRIAIGAAVPDLTIIVDVPPDVALSRLRSRGNGTDRFEGEKAEEFEARRDRFLQIARDEPRRCAVVDGARSMDDVRDEIAALVSERLGLSLADAR